MPQSQSSDKYGSHRDSTPTLSLNADVGILGTSIGCEWDPNAFYGVRAEMTYFGSIVGAKDFLELGTFGSSTYLLLRSSFALEQRGYYNYRKLLKDDSQTRSAKYIAIRMQCNTPWLLSTVEESSPSRVERDHAIYPSVFKNLDLIPLWGMRSEKGRLFLEFNTGYIIHLKDVFKKEAIFRDLRFRLLCRLGLRL